MAQKTREATVRAAEIVREYGPFAGSARIHGVTHDGRNVWAATDNGLVAFDPASGDTLRKFERPADAGTAFDGKYLYQIAESRIDKIDPATGSVVATIPAPGKGNDSGLTWAEGSLWVGQYRDRKIHQIDPATGAIKRTIESNRFVTGVTFVDGEMWHGTWEGEESELRRIDPDSGDVLERLPCRSRRSTACSTRSSRTCRGSRTSRWRTCCRATSPRWCVCFRCSSA